MRLALIKSILIIAVVIAGSAPACADTTVFAAASLTNVLNDIMTRYTRDSGRKVKASYAASSTLAKQIESGAPAQIFVSADLEWMSYLEKRGYVAGKPQVLAGNRLVLIAPADSKVSVNIGRGMNLAGMLGSEKLALADPASVPAGRYAQAALEHYGEWDALRGKILPFDNVRVCLAVVEQNEAPLGIVYATDAAVSGKVRVVGEFPEESHAPIVYPAALIAQNRDADADAFFAFLSGTQARAIFAKYGFGAAP